MTRAASSARRAWLAEVGAGDAAAHLRPTSDRVREAIFNALGAFEGASVLDLFAGSGALGLESLSRGAVWCTFVEGDRKVVWTLKENIASLGLEQVTEVIVAKYTAGLSVVERKGRRYDVVFLDPPYHMTEQVLERVTPRLEALVNPGGLVVVETRKSGGLVPGWESVFARTYGDTGVRISRRGDETQ